jgi:hypothetical protein
VIAYLCQFHRFWFSLAFLITDLLTVGLHLRDVLEILLRLDDRQCMSKALVLDDCSMAHALILVEDPVGKHLSLPAHLQTSVGKVIEVDILAAQILGEGTAIQDELLAIIRQGQLLTDVTLFAVAEDTCVCRSWKRCSPPLR